MLRAALCLLFALASGNAVSAHPARGEFVYKGAIVIDAATGAVLFANHADEVSPPASMTKLMTFAVLQDRIASGALSLQTRVRIVAADTRAAPTIIGLKVNEVFPLEELIYAMLIPSANDAALAVAREVAGSVPACVDLMNAKARELGMSHTIFRNPNGLPPPNHRVADGNLTTPRDFALLCRYLILHTTILKYTSVKNRQFGVNYRFPSTSMTNHNHLLGKIAGVDGLKTGFTNSAGFCLATTAKRQGRRIIVVMMDCPDSRDRDLAVIQMLESSFSMRPFLQTSIAAPTTAPAGPGNGLSAPTRPAAGSPTIQFTVPGPGR
jgi:D-alanyl-D-alanine carboxypeptidase